MSKELDREALSKFVRALAFALLVLLDKDKHPPRSRRLVPASRI